MGIYEVLCPICGSDLIEDQWVFYENRDVSPRVSSFACANTESHKPDICTCKVCGHWFSNPLGWPTALENILESVIDYEYVRLQYVKQKTHFKSAMLVSKLFSKPGNLIEIGSYTGVFLDQMSILGWKCLGIEPSRWAAELAAENGHLVKQGTFESIVSTEKLHSADLIVSWDVLEHVRDPRRFLRDASSLMGENAYLVLSTLDRGSIFARAMGKKWPWIIDMHLHYFDTESLEKLAGSMGLRLIKYGPHVHYSTISYILKKLFPNLSLHKLVPKLISSFPIPVSLGDVKYYVFEKSTK